MAVLDRAMRNLAVRLSNVFGKSVSVVMQYPGYYDPATRGAGTQSVEVTVNGVLGAYRVDQFGDQIQMGDVPVWLPARDIERPRPGDLLTIDGKAMRAIHVTAHYAGDQPALYECQVRQ